MRISLCRSLSASIVLAWLTATGRFAWWPVLVFFSSVAAQTQLVYAIPSAVLILGPPVVALVLSREPRSLRWLKAGLAVGLVCWSLPLYQSLGSNGNLFNLLTTHHRGGSMGATFGLRAVAMTSSLSPLWIHSAPKQFTEAVMIIDRNSAVLGVVAIVVMVFIGVVAKRAGLTLLAAGAAMCALLLVAAAASFAIVPKTNAVSIPYMMCIFWATSVFVWTVALCAVGKIVIWGLTRNGDVSAGQVQVCTARSGGVVVLVTLVAATAGLVSVRSFVPSVWNVGLSRKGFDTIRAVTTQIERKANPSRSVALVSQALAGGASNDIAASYIWEGVAWRLVSDGWRPGLSGEGRDDTGLVPARNPRWFLILVRGQEEVGVKQVRCPAE